MIVGIGTDVVSIGRIRSLLERYGERFLKRCFTEEEVRYALKKPDCAQSLASSWAAKEATGKSLANGIDKNIPFTSIGLKRKSNGSPEIVLRKGAYARAKALASGKKFTAFVSISHEKDMAHAIVVIESP